MGSRVRSVSMDSWSHPQVLTMLEGGNEQLHNFYDRHHMEKQNSKVFHHRYQTNAARFYRKNMEAHVEKIKRIGRWRGRTASRKAATASSGRTTKTTVTTTNTNHRYPNNTHRIKPFVINPAAA